MVYVVLLIVPESAPFGTLESYLAQSVAEQCFMSSSDKVQSTSAQSSPTEPAPMENDSAKAPGTGDHPSPPSTTTSRADTTSSTSSNNGTTDASLRELLFDFDLSHTLRAAPPFLGKQTDPRAGARVSDTESSSTTSARATDTRHAPSSQPLKLRRSFPSYPQDDAFLTLLLPLLAEQAELERLSLQPKDKGAVTPASPSSTSAAPSS
ncbi:hypothetical protein V3C99_009753 [Haemonchus contortus]